MEETDFVSPKLTKSETTQKLKSHPSSSTRGGGSKNTRKHHPTPSAAGEGGSNNTRKHHPTPHAAGEGGSSNTRNHHQTPPAAREGGSNNTRKHRPTPPAAGEGGSNNTRKHHPSPPAAGEGGSNNTRKHHPAPPAAGQVAFRLLCHDHTAGGVIGSSGSIIKHLETLTGSKIRFEESIPNCHERVINIVGDAVVGRTISVGTSEEYEMVDVSKAQEGLMRVFERVLEVEGNAGNNGNEDNKHNSNGLISCRLLAQKGQIGGLIGKRGKILDGIRKSSGAKIRVFKEEQIPACAGPEEELIQIMGSVMAVKRAILAVSSRLQDQTLGERAPGHMSSNRASCALQADSSPEQSPNSPSVLESVVEHHSVVHSLSADVNRTLHLDEDSLRNVVFKFLCPNSIAGGVIGKGANIVKFLEKETGASIKFASPVSGSKERVAIISSLENPDPLYSPAQIAAVRVFSRCIEVGLDKGVLSSLGNKENVVARILVASDQAGCLLDEGGRIASDISITSGVDIQLMRADLVPNCAGADDNVVQITGNYENVKSALFQVTGRLRQNLFSGAVPKGTDWKHGSYSAIPSSSPDGRDAAGSPTQLVQSLRLSYIHQLDHLGFVQKPTSSYQPGSQLGQANSISSIPEPVDGAHGLTTFPSGLKQESNVGNEEPKQTVEVVVPGEVFRFVYGENCSNLDRLKEISGATVVLQDPCPGESSGKVIISGTPGRIQIAQSLLQAFISF